MKEIINKGIQYNNYSIKKLKFSKSMPFIKDNNELKYKNKNMTYYNLFPPKTVKCRNKSNNYLKNLSYRKSRNLGNNNDVFNNNDNCFYFNSYVNNNYQISDRENI